MDLLQAVARYGDRDWIAVARDLGDRTAPQCLHRWRAALESRLSGGRKGPWTEEEDQQLKHAMAVTAKSAKGKVKWSEARSKDRLPLFVIPLPSFLRNLIPMLALFWHGGSF